MYVYIMQILCILCPCRRLVQFMDLFQIDLEKIQ